MTGLAATLVAAVLMIITGSTLVPERSFRGSVQAIFPTAKDSPPWTVKFRPVAESAEMQKAVGELLNFDDAAYAIYTNGAMQVSLYAAYWSPGKMSHRLVAGHTPDVCWVGGGWERVKADRTELKLDESVSPGEDRVVRARKPEGHTQLLGTDLFPMEYREFKLSGRTEYVVFCHVVGGRAMSYGTEGVPPWYSFLGDLWGRGLRQREEQFFVRISSNRSLAEFSAAPPVRIFLRRLVSDAFSTGVRSGGNSP